MRRIFIAIAILISTPLLAETITYQGKGFFHLADTHPAPAPLGPCQKLVVTFKDYKIVQAKIHCFYEKGPLQGKPFVKEVQALEHEPSIGILHQHYSDEEDYLRLSGRVSPSLIWFILKEGGNNYFIKADFKGSAI